MKGSVLASVLMVVALASLGAFMLAGSATFHLSVSVHTENIQTARNLAESAIAQTLEALGKNQEFGKKPGDHVVLAIPAGSPAGTSAVVTFDPAEADRLHVPLSFNNFSLNDPQKQQAQVVRGITVPPGAVLMIGSATCGSSTQRVLAMVAFPNFPYAIATSGAFRGDGILVSGATNANDVVRDANGNLAVRPDREVGGEVASNSGRDDALVIAGNSLVTGDAQAVGGIQAPPGKVLGTLRDHSAPIVIPDIDIGAFSQKDLPISQELPGNMQDPSIQGFAQCPGTLSIEGDLHLDGGIVFVQGDLSINGGLRGRGAVFVMGKTTIKGAVDLKSDDLAALVTQGDVSIAGDGRNQNVFQGLIYTKGNFHAQNVSLLGTFLATKSQSLGGSTTTLSNVNVLHVDGVSKVEALVGTIPLGFLVDYNQGKGLTTSQALIKALESVSVFGPVGSRFSNMTFSLEKTSGGTLQVVIRAINQDTGQLMVQTFPADQSGLDAYAQQVTTFLIASGGGADASKNADFNTIRATIAPFWNALVTLKEQNAPKLINFSFDPNQFINPADTIRILEWKDDF